MKNIKPLFACLVTICALIFCTSFKSENSTQLRSPEEKITFFQVELVCNAAPDIGCGSRSKPILLDLETLPDIKEAWLNRAGTIIGVVWTENSEPDYVLISTVFSKHNKKMKLLEGDSHIQQLDDFKSGKWYKGEAVDELSMEEAGRIANQIMNFLIQEKLIAGETAEMMFKEIEQFIQDEFLALKDVSLLSSKEYYDGWEEEIFRIGQKYIPNNLMPELELYSPIQSSCTNQSKGCKSGSDSKKCCGPSSACKSKVN